MELKHESETLQRADKVNRPILDAALVDHDKHYWCLCRWVEQELKNPRRRHAWGTGPGAISHILGEGHTAATVIWETYSR